MRIVATVCCRNSEWCLGLTLRAIMSWVDDAVVLDHASSDNTAGIIRDVSALFPGRIHAFHDANPEWQEMRHRDMLLNEARKVGATHIAIVDDDEILSGNLIPSIRDHIERIRPGQMLQLPWACMQRGDIGRYYTGGVWFNNWVTTAFADFDRLGWTSAQRGGYDFHHRHPMVDGRPDSMLEDRQPVPQKVGGLMHLQFASERRVRAKALAYAVTERIRWPNRTSAEALNWMYGRAVYESNPHIFSTEAAPDSWWSPYANILHHLDIDSVPWQLERVRDLVAQHGREVLTGLDLYGLEI